MENATQALFMAAGVLIALVVISLGIMFFSSASSIGESYEIKMSAVEIQKFNNQFEKYSKQPQYVRAYEDSGTTQYHYITDIDDATVEKNEYVFHDYNSISDVVSAINLAYNINSANDYEQDASIQISVKGLNDVNVEFPEILGINPSIQKNHYNSNPKTLIDKHCIYKLDDIDNKKIYEGIIRDVRINLNDVLKEFNTSKLDDNNERIYKYGFKGETVINEKTGLIDIVKFELVENENYDG